MIVLHPKISSLGNFFLRDSWNWEFVLSDRKKSRYFCKFLFPIGWRALVRSFLSGTWEEWVHQKQWRWLCWEKGLCPLQSGKSSTRKKWNVGNSTCPMTIEFFLTGKWCLLASWFNSCESRRRVYNLGKYQQRSMLKPLRNFTLVHICTVFNPTSPFMLH